MCMFNDPPKKSPIKERWAWKVMIHDKVTHELVNLVMINHPTQLDTWMAAQHDRSGNFGFCVWCSWLGAWLHKKSISTYWLVADQSYKIVRVKVQGTVHGVGRGDSISGGSPWCLGMRVQEMFIPTPKFMKKQDKKSREITQ